MGMERFQMMMITLDELVPEDHFLRQMAERFPWKNWAEPFKKCFKGEKEYGPHGYEIATLLKMTVLSFLYNLSDKQTENYVKDTIAAKYFVGLDLRQDVPDETTLCRFRGRIIEKGKEYMLKELFDRVLQRAPKMDIKIGKVQILDSVHTESCINKDKEDRENEKRKKDGEPPKPPKDPDATWGCKGRRKKKDPETGKVTEHPKWFHGYKTHVSLNSTTGLATSILVSTGREADVHASKFLLDDDREKGIITTIVTADKAYDDGDLFMYCGKHEIFPAIALRNTRTECKSKRIRTYWENHKSQPFYKKALAWRYKIEQKFGEAKLNHGLRFSRYRGIHKFALQAVFTFMAMNLKRIIKLVGQSLIGGAQLCKT